MQPQTKRPRLSTSLIPLIIVEDHHLLLPHFHRLLRSKNLPWSFSLIHFDSHPDLSCPPFPASTPPRSQHHLLNASQSGIAEWILPLIIYSHITATVWIKQTFCNQIPDGHHNLYVGASPAAHEHMRVASAATTLKYYAEEDHQVHLHELTDAKPFPLQVITSPIAPSLAPPFATPWVLDVCLDYFACLSPFITPEMHTILPPLQILKRFFNERNCVDDLESKLYYRKYVQLMEFFECYIRDVAKDYLPANASRGTPNAALGTPNCVTTPLALALFGTNMLRTTSTLKALRSALHCALSTTTDLPLLLQDILELLPNLSLPHSPSSFTSLPATLSTFKADLQTLLTTAATPPALITIARSATDGFMNVDVVDDLQRDVVDIITSLLGAGCIEVIKDYDVQISKKRIIK